MPIVNVVLPRKGAATRNAPLSAEETARLMKGVSNVLTDVLGTPADEILARAFAEAGLEGRLTLPRPGESVRLSAGA